MRPTTVELLESIAQALEDQVLPVIQDKWGASTLRSAMQLLRHLALRVPLEAGILAADNDDARRVLTLVSDRLRQLGETDLAAAAVAALGARTVDPLDVTGSDALNENYLRAVETIIAARDRFFLTKFRHISCRLTFCQIPWPRQLHVRAGVLSAARVTRSSFSKLEAPASRLASARAASAVRSS